MKKILKAQKKLLEEYENIRLNSFKHGYNETKHSEIVANFLNIEIASFDKKKAIEALEYLKKTKHINRVVSVRFDYNLTDKPWVCKKTNIDKLIQANRSSMCQDILKRLDGYIDSCLMLGKK